MHFGVSHKSYKKRTKKYHIEGIVGFQLNKPILKIHIIIFDSFERYPK